MTSIGNTQDDLALECHGRSSLGDREKQEDAFAHVLLDDGQAQLLVVADGMGGHVGGEIASQLALEAFVDCFVNDTKGEPHRRLKTALIMANHALAERIRIDPELDGMGTTLVAAYLSAAGLAWISVGDSLLLLVREGQIQRLNADHSMAPVIERQFLAGKLTREEADRHPERNVLLSVLDGWHSPDLIDCSGQPLPLKDGDCIIAASDGLLTLGLTEILGAACSGNGAKTISEALLAKISEKAEPFQDNSTVLVARVSR